MFVNDSCIVKLSKLSIMFYLKKKIVIVWAIVTCNNLWQIAKTDNLTDTKFNFFNYNIETFYHCYSLRNSINLYMFTLKQVHCNLSQFTMCHVKLWYSVICCEIFDSHGRSFVVFYRVVGTWTYKKHLCFNFYAPGLVLLPESVCFQMVIEAAKN